LYSNENQDTKLIYPTYEESMKRFKKAHKALKQVLAKNPDIHENSPIEERVDYVGAFQELNNSFEALVTYDDFNDDMEKSKALQEQVQTIAETVGVYNTVKASLIAQGPEGGDGVEDEPDLSGIEFYAD